MSVPAEREWPALVRLILEGADMGREPLWKAVVAACRRTTDADGAAIVRWGDDGPHIVAREGRTFLPPTRRPQEGAFVANGQPVAVARMGHATDLVVVRPSGSAPFDRSTSERLRTMTAVATGVGGHSRQALGALLEVATTLLAAHELEAVLLAVVNAAAQVLQAEIAGLLLTDASGEVLEMRCAVGNQTVETAHLQVSKGEGLAGKVLESGRPERVDDYVSDDTISKEFLAVASREGTQSALCAPMIMHGRTTGVVSVWRRRRSVFTEQDVQVMTALANLGAVAVENARLRDAEQRSAAALQRAHEELEDRYRDTEYALRVHEELTRIAVEGEDLDSVISAVASLTGCHAALVSPDVVRMAGDSELFEENIRRMVSETGTGGSGRMPKVLEGYSDDMWTLAAPVRMASASFGFLCLGFPDKPRSVDRVVAAQAATVCALLLAREEAALSTMRRLQSEFVWDLLEGRIPDRTEAVIRTRHLRHDFSLPVRVVLVKLKGLAAMARDEDWDPHLLEAARTRAAQRLSEIASEVGGTAPVVAQRADLFVALVARPARDPARAVRTLGEALAAEVLVDGVQQTVGMSELVESFGGFPECFQQARLSLSACARDRPAVAFEELGVIQFLLAPRTRGDLSQFAHRVLGPVVEYDRARDTDLLVTLEAYLASDCKLKPAAERLFVHHKTVRYRLDRVEELTGLRLDRQEDRFNAQLAVKILHLDEGGV